MSRNHKRLFWHIMSCIGCFVLGLYACYTKYNIQAVEPYRWTITILSVCFFIIMTWEVER